MHDIYKLFFMFFNYYYYFSIKIQKVLCKINNNNKKLKIYKTGGINASKNSIRFKIRSNL